MRINGSLPAAATGWRHAPLSCKVVPMKNVACAWFSSQAVLMTAQEIRTLPTAEKLQIMETIWDDLRERFESTDVSPSLRKMLDARRERGKRGEVAVLDWDSVKSTIGRA